MYNNWLHKSVANSTLYNVAMKDLPLLSHIFIWTFYCLFLCDKILICNFNIFICFHQWAWYKIRNIWCHVTSRTWVYNPIFSCDLSSKYLLALYMLAYINSIDTYIFCDLFWYVLFSEILHIFIDLYAQGLGFSVLQKLSHPKCPVSDNLRWNDPPIHIWRTYLISNRYVQYAYF